MLRAASVTMLLMVVACLGGCAGTSKRSATSAWSGAWALSDATGPTDLVLFDNGQCILVSADRKPGTKGARGYHRQNGEGVLCIFEDGSAVELVPRKAGYAWTSESPGERRRPWKAAVRSSAPQDRFIGLWRLNPEPTGEYLYVQLHAGGYARNSLVSAAGKWKPWQGGALCSWPGGWRDWLAERDGGFVHRAWPPGSSLDDDPSDFSTAQRVGEKPFAISP